jgi:hypothetical protein
MNEKQNLKTLEPYSRGSLSDQTNNVINQKFKKYLNIKQPEYSIRKISNCKELEFNVN